MNPKEYKEMCKMMGKVKKDPELRKQMEGYWKMLDNMHQSSPDEYTKFIGDQMTEMKSTNKIEREKAEK